MSHNPTLLILEEGIPIDIMTIPYLGDLPLLRQNGTTNNI